MREELQVLHTNDLHSHLERWPKIRRFLTNQRRLAKRKGIETFTFDIGDALDRQNALTEATMGQANVDLMNEVHYDAVTIGNNEDLGMNHDALNRLYTHAQFPVLVANLTDAGSGQLPDWAFEKKILTTTAGTRVGVLGLTAPFILTLPLLGWLPKEVDAVLPQLLADLRKQVDVIILLSHLGLPMDRYLADRYSDIDLILGAHTHHLLPEGEWRSGTLLAAAGRYGEHLGKIHLTLVDHQVLSAQATTIKTDDLPSLPDDQGEIDALEQRGHRLLAKKVFAKLEAPYERSLGASHRVIDLGVAALKWYTQTDLVMLSTGMFLTDLPAGEVTADELHTMLPHAVHPMRTTLTGADLKRLVQEVHKNQPYLANHRVHGMGFRGDTFGQVLFDGLREDAQGTLYVQDVPVEDRRDYRLGTLEHYMFIPYFPTLEIAGKNELMYQHVFREVVGAYLAKESKESGEHDS